MSFNGTTNLREGDWVWCCDPEGSYYYTTIPEGKCFKVFKDGGGFFIQVWDYYTRSYSTCRGKYGVWRIGSRGVSTSTSLYSNFNELGFKEGDRVQCIKHSYKSKNVSRDLFPEKTYTLKAGPEGLYIKLPCGERISGLFGEWKKVPKHQGPFSAIILDRDGIEVGREEDVPVSVSNEGYKISFFSSN